MNTAEGIYKSTHYPLTEDERDLLERCKACQPWWWRAVIKAAQVMPDRRGKYAGNLDPYFNFQDVARRRNVTVEEVFEWYLDMKTSRLAARSGDFPDESLVDTHRDRANYALLSTGYLIRQQNEVK